MYWKLYCTFIGSYWITWARAQGTFPFHTSKRSPWIHWLSCTHEIWSPSVKIRKHSPAWVCNIPYSLAQWRTIKRWWFTILRGNVTGNRGMFTPFAFSNVYHSEPVWCLLSLSVQGMFLNSFCFLSFSLQILTDWRNVAGLRVPRDVAEAPHRWSSVADPKVEHVQLYQVSTLLSMTIL